jgi:hypothetical protein
LHTLSEHWQHFQSVFLSLAAGQIEQLPGYKMVQLYLGGVRERGKKSKKQYMRQMMIILCPWDFNEQIEKLVRSLLNTSENCSRKFHVWVHFVPSQ